MNTQHSPSVDHLIRIDDVARLVGLSARQAWRLDRAGKLPSPVRIGRAVRWRSGEIQAWFAAGCPPRDEWAVRWEALQRAMVASRARAEN